MTNEKNNTSRKLTAKEVADDYVCNKVCRICPYPGLKCTQERSTLRKIQ